MRKRRKLTKVVFPGLWPNRISIYIYIYKYIPTETHWDPKIICIHYKKRWAKLGQPKAQPKEERWWPVWPEGGVQALANCISI